MRTEEILEQILGKLEEGKPVFVTYNNRSLTGKGELQISEAEPNGDEVTRHGTSLLKHQTERIDVPEASDLLWGSLIMTPDGDQVSFSGRMRVKRGLTGRHEFDCRVGLREIHERMTDATSLYLLVWILFQFADERTNLTTG